MCEVVWLSWSALDIYPQHLGDMLAQITVHTTRGPAAVSWTRISVSQPIGKDVGMSCSKRQQTDETPENVAGSDE